jgi:DNA-binding PadR family transcriptional regulator
MDDLAKRVLRNFAHWNKESLDLHTLFEIGGNDPDARTAVFDTVERLVKEGLLEELGNDFYALTEEGREAARRD